MANQLSVAFVVNVLLPEDSADTLTRVAEEIESSLNADGHNVASVAPYQRESLAAAGLQFPTINPD